MVPSVLLSIWFGVKAYGELAKDADLLSTIALGWFAGQDYFTPKGRRYRLWSLACIGGGSLAIVLIRLVTK
jgi:hypothetical protein